MLYDLEVSVLPRFPVPESVQQGVLSAFRVVVALLFVCHGAKSLFGVLGAEGTTRLFAWPGWWAAAIQLVGGVLVLVGLGTRGAALVASGSMAYAYFSVHAERALWPIQNGGEASAIFCWSFLLIAVFGPGRYAVDQLLSRRGNTSAVLNVVPAEDSARLAA